MPRRMGLNVLSPKKRREIASKGGNAAQASGKAHRWTPAEARAMGRKGGRPKKRKEREV